MHKLNFYNDFRNYLAKNKALKWPFRIFSILFIVAVLAQFIANDKPLVFKYEDNWLFPAFSFKNNYVSSISNQIINYNMGKQWKLLETSFSIFPICAYSPNTIDAENAPLISPFDNQFFLTKDSELVSLPIKYRHWLGTTSNGNDVLACIIHGAKISISVGILSMLIASIIGISLGAVAGFFQDNKVKIGYFESVFSFIGLFFAWFYGYKVRENAFINTIDTGILLMLCEIVISIVIFISMVIIFKWLGKKIDKLLRISNTLFLPLDLIISKLIETLNSIPTLLLIITVAAITKPSYLILVLIIGFLSWTNIARVVRAEFMKAKELDYVTACYAIGISNYKIITKHILPNVFPIIFIQLVFGIASTILVESSLSFIGVGVPIETKTWGNLLYEAQNSFSAWWLVVFPGICIFGLVLVFNKIATHLTSKLK